MGTLQARPENADGFDQALAHLQDRDNPAKDHRANTHIANLGTPKFPRAIDRIAFQEHARRIKHGQGNHPGEHAPDEDQQRHIQAHDQAHCHEHGRNVRAVVKDARSKCPRGFKVPRKESQEIPTEFDHGSQGATHNQGLGTATFSPVAALFSRLQHRGASDPFRIGQFRIVHHKHLAHGNHEQRTEQSAGERDTGCGPIIKVGPVPGQHQSRHGKDDARGKRLSSRCAGLHLVRFQDRAAPQHHPQDQHGHHRRRNRSGHSHAGLEAHIDVRGAHHQGEQNPEEDRDGGQFAFGRDQGGF